MKFQKGEIYKIDLNENIANFMFLQETDNEIIGLIFPELFNKQTIELLKRGVKDSSAHEFLISYRKINERYFATNNYEVIFLNS